MNIGALKRGVSRREVQLVRAGQWVDRPHPVPPGVSGTADCTCGTGDAGHPHGELVRGCPGWPLYPPPPPGCAFPLPA